MSRDTPPMDDRNKDIRQLDQRVNELEATIKQMLPSRRDALKLGGAAALGAAAMSGSASAGTSQVGTIGSASDRVDVQAEDIDVSDTLTTSNLVVSDSVKNDQQKGLWGPWVLEHHIERADVSAASFTSFNVSGDFLKIVVRKVKPATLYLRINGISTDYTEFNFDETGTINKTTGNAEWALLHGANVGAHGTWYISNNQRTTISGHGGVRDLGTHKTLLKGSMEEQFMTDIDLKADTGSGQFLELEIYRYDESYIL